MRCQPNTCRRLDNAKDGEFDSRFGVLQDITVMQGHAWGMAQPHKGDREMIASRIPRSVYEIIRTAAAERDISMSQYVADVMCEHTGHGELVRDLRQEVLPQSA